MSIVNPKTVKVKRHEVTTPRNIENVVIKNDPPERRVLAFAFIVVGILANWLWSESWRYLADPSQALFSGNYYIILVRLFLSLCIAALTFLPIYERVYRLPAENWVICFIAFQNGFFWQSAFYGVMQHFQH